MAPGAASTDLPVSLYESVIDMVNLQVCRVLKWPPWHQPMDYFCVLKHIPQWHHEQHTIFRQECCLLNFPTLLPQRKQRELDWTTLPGFLKSDKKQNNFWSNISTGLCQALMGERAGNYICPLICVLVKILIRLFFRAADHLMAQHSAIKMLASRVSQS